MANLPESAKYQKILYTEILNHQTKIIRSVLFLAEGQLSIFPF
jgi:hypothetical protein